MVDFREEALQEKLTCNKLFSYEDLINEGNERIDAASVYAMSLHQYEQLGKPYKNGIQLTQKIRAGLTSLHMTLIPTLLFALDNQALFFMHDDDEKFIYIAHYNNRTHVSEVVMTYYSNKEFIHYLNAAVVDYSRENPDLTVNTLRCMALRRLSDMGDIKMKPVKIECSCDRDLMVCRYYQYSTKLGYTDNYKHFRLSYLCLRGLQPEMFNELLASDGELTLNHMDNHRSILNVDNYELCTVAENNKHARMIKELSHFKSLHVLFYTVVDKYTKNYGTYTIDGCTVTGRIPHLKIQIAEPFCLSAHNIDNMAQIIRDWSNLFTEEREKCLQEQIANHMERFYSNRVGKLDIYALVSNVITFC